MEIEWRVKNGEDPYKHVERAAWDGIRVHRAQVAAGRMLEHIPTSHELNINISGVLVNEKISAGGNIVTTLEREKSICLTNAGQAARAHWDAPLDNLGILLDPVYVSNVAAEHRISSSFEFNTYYVERDDLVLNIGLALLTEAESQNPGGKLYADSLTQSLTLHLIRNYTAGGHAVEIHSGGLSGYKLKRVTDFINDNLEKNLGLLEIASIASLSQFHFARSFRKATGQTPQQYVTHRRIERAKELLSKGELPIVEVSLRSGFKNQSHFTTLFRKYTSLTPKHWRELKLA